MAKRQSKQAKLIDAEISRAFYKNFSGVQINVMDIGKIFDAGRLAAASGAEIEAAVIAATEAVRLN